MWAIIAAAVLLLLLAGTGILRKNAVSAKMTNTSELSGKKLGGITGEKLNAEQAEVFFETLLGTALSGYEEAQSISELLWKLKSGRVSAIECPDFVANYLLNGKDGDWLSRLSAPKDQASNGENGRLEFALTLRTEDTSLCEELNRALSKMKEEHVTDVLERSYITAEKESEYYHSGKNDGKCFYVGVTGCYPPMDRFDSRGVPSGYSVALFEELENRTGYSFRLIPIAVGQQFTALTSGKVDILMDYGTSKTTTPGTKNYIQTGGFLTMKEYAYLTLR